MAQKYFNLDDQDPFDPTQPPPDTRYGATEPDPTVADLNQPVNQPVTVASSPEPDRVSPWVTPPADGNWQQWFLNNVQGLAPGSDSLAQLEPQLLQAGVKVLKNASGVSGKIQLPDGRIVDVGRAFSSGNPSQMGWQWLEGADGGDSSGGVDPSYLAPWEVPFESPSFDLSGTPYATKDANDLWSFLYPEFKAPSAEDAFADPSFQFRQNRGRNALETSAAAKGLLNSGGTLKDLLEYGQNFASQEYANIFDRDLAKYGTNRTTAQQNFGTNYGLRQDAFNRARTVWDDARDTFYKNQDRPFDKLTRTAQIGAGASV